MGSEMKNPFSFRRFAYALAAIAVVARVEAAEAPTAAGYDGLVKLFEEWRAFEHPPLKDGAPDYTTETTFRRLRELAAWRDRLEAIDSSDWPLEAQVDKSLVRAEMNGFDFHARVLQPWARDPAYYMSVWAEQSDTPAHEGTVHHDIVELWTYEFPLSRDAEAKLARELAIIPPLLAQARGNLTGNAHDLWVTGAGTMRGQIAALDALTEKTTGNGRALKNAIRKSREATVGLVEWLEAQAPSKTGPSGVGKENYSWSLKNVHLVPMNWDEEVDLLKRELARAHASLKLEEAREQRPARTAGDPDARGVPAPRQRGGEPLPRVPAEARSLSDARQHGPGAARKDRRIRAARDAKLLRDRDALRAAHALHPLLPLVGPRTHARRAASEPDPSRSPPLQHLGLPRRGHGDGDGRIHAARRPLRRLSRGRARSSGSCSPSARREDSRRSTRRRTIFDLKQAKAFQVEWTPRGWMRPDLDLLGFEQQLYLRQPGYGTSYVTGKHLLDDLMRVRAHQLGADFSLRRILRRGERRWPDPGPDDPLAADRPEDGIRPASKIKAAHDSLPRRSPLHSRRMPTRPLDYNVLHAGKKSGAQKTVIGNDGRMHVSYSYRDNGRGPDIEEDITLAPDGTIKSYRQRGKTTYGAVLDERFSATRGRASWQSPSERGSRESATPAIYLPSYGSPETSAIIVRATQKAGGRLPGLPGGELQQREARGRPRRAGRAGACRRAVRDLRRRPATGLRLARGGRGHAPLRQHQRRRKPHGRRPASRA